MGLTIFAVLMTIWLARPVEYSVPLRFVLASILGYAIGGSAGILQANYALNRYLHNTQWVIGIHGHVQLLAGLTLTLFAVIYAVAPIITGKELDSKLADIHLILFFAGALIMGLAMGIAGVEGMLRRTLYYNGEYTTYMLTATIGGILMAGGYLIFFYNVIKTYGLRAILSVFR